MYEYYIRNEEIQLSIDEANTRLEDAKNHAEHVRRVCKMATAMADAFDMLTRMTQSTHYSIEDLELGIKLAEKEYETGIAQVKAMLENRKLEEES